MKRLYKIFIFISIFLGLSLYLIFSEYHVANNEVKFLYCLDGDSAVFELNGKETEVRLLAIDCPEINDPCGMKARDFCKEILDSAGEIELVRDEGSDDEDKYERELYWVITDGELLQLKLVKEGLAKVDYIYGDYRYTDELKKAENEARNNKLGIWSLQ
ncbi:MAG: thermonuclease family protein [Erysipelotrichaceae bacterium]|nr:thermonuclease family protein [Erysipelotrichaceae bacterium]